MIKKLLFILVVLAGIFSIQKLNEIDQRIIVSNRKPYPDISRCIAYKPLDKYVISFADEAYQRNIYFGLDGVTLLVSKLDNAAAITYGSLKLILVDTTSEAWKVNPESLVYHELGHYVLGRTHYDSVYYFRHYRDTTVYRYPLSIMHSFLTKEYNNDGMFSRKYYIDELFDATKFDHLTHPVHRH